MKKEYVNILKLFNSKKYDKFDVSTPEINPDIAAKLISYKYLQGTNHSSMVCPNAFKNVSITDEGREQLKLWEGELRKEQFKSYSERVLWIFLGVFLTVMVEKIF